MIIQCVCCKGIFSYKVANSSFKIENSTCNLDFTDTKAFMFWGVFGCMFVFTVSPKIMN